MSFDKFEIGFPSHQAAVNLFAGKWASDLSKVAQVVGTGSADLFVEDPRPGMAAKALGDTSGRLNGMSILELGPLEAGHSYQLEHLGAASILGVEANAEAYLKCLVVKEILGMRNFVWTHYYDATSGDKEGARTARRVEVDGFAAAYYELDYADRQEGTFWGGNADTRAWMEQAAILDCFRHFGLDDVKVVQDVPGHQHGASMSFVASRVKMAN